MKTFIDILNLQAERFPEKIAYTFLLDGENKKQNITFKQLTNNSKLLAKKLLDKTEIKDRILLCYPPGLEYILAFYACLYAGRIAVPVYPPDQRNCRRINSIIRNAKAKIALCSHEIAERVNADNSSTGLKLAHNNMQWLSFDVLNNEETIVNLITSVDPTETAFLQYTSGSTNNPKGVKVSHENLVTNCRLMQQVGHHNEECIKISWLPPYHDMGLIGSILQPLYSGMTSVIMSPASFLKKPVRWLQAISNYRELGSVTSGGPNFSYDWCCDYIPENQLEGLDLSGWRIAYNGAEPVRAETLERFNEKFKSVGFKFSSFKPVYGLAEATLMVSFGILAEKPVIKNFNVSLLQKNIASQAKLNGTETKKLVGCGTSFDSQKVVVVNPHSKELMENNQVGEIWIKGDSIASGYWDNEEATFDTFGHVLNNTNEGPFMRTGDLGFIDSDSNALFITGRIKDLIIIHGQNFYPQDIEEEAESASTCLKSRSGAAFSIDIENMEVLVLVYELKRKYSQSATSDEIVSAIRDAIFRKFGLAIYDIQFIEPSSFPKTSSGKVQRQLAKKIYLAEKFKIQQPNPSIKIQEVNK